MPLTTLVFSIAIFSVRQVSSCGGGGPGGGRGGGRGQGGGFRGQGSSNFGSSNVQPIIEQPQQPVFQQEIPPNHKGMFFIHVYFPLCFLKILEQV